MIFFRAVFLICWVVIASVVCIIVVDMWLYPHVFVIVMAAHYHNCS